MMLILPEPFFIARKSSAAGKSTVVDATNVQPGWRKPLVELLGKLGSEFGVPALAGNALDSPPSAGFHGRAAA